MVLLEVLMHGQVQIPLPLPFKTRQFQMRAAANAGTYTVTVTSDGCTATATTTVVVNNIPDASAGSSSVCLGEPIQLTSSGGGFEYAWSGPNGFTSTVQNPLITSAAASNGGTYTVTVTGAGSCVGTATAVIVVNSPPVASAATSPVCLGATANLTASGGVSYSWTGPAGFISNVQNPAITSADFSHQGNYVVIVTDANGCSATSATSLTVNETTAIASANSPVCLDGSLNLMASGGGTYQWSGPNSFSSTSATPIINNITAAGAGNYLVTVTNNGCTDVAAVEVTVNETISTIAGNDFCANSTIQLQATGGGTYSWSGPASFTSSQQNPFIANTTATNAGIYTVTVTKDGCTDINTVNLVLLLASTGNETYDGCADDGYTVTVNGTVYDENNPAGTEVLVAENGCDSVVTINLVFKPKATNTINQTLCTGGSIVVNGTTYNEANPSGIETVSGGAINGCDSIITVNLSFNSFATSTLTHDGCQGDGYSVVVNGVTYNEANQSGIETITGGSYLGCDSIITVTLIYKPNSTGSETYNGCQGDGLFRYGQWNSL
jgi:hypothetical protein